MSQSDVTTSVSTRRSIARERLRYGFLNQATRQLDEVVALLEADDSPACREAVVDALRRLAQTADALKLGETAKSAAVAVSELEGGSRNSALFLGLRSALLDAGAGARFPPWLICCTPKLERAFQRQAVRCSEEVQLVADLASVQRRIESGGYQGLALPVEQLGSVRLVPGQLVLAYGEPDDWEGRMRAVEAGAMFLSRPHRLVDVLRPLRAAIFDAVSRERVVLMGDESEAMRPIYSRLRAAGFVPVATRDRRHLLGLVRSGRPEVVVLHGCEDEVPLLRVLGAVADGPAIVVTTRDMMRVDELYEAGAVDVLPVDVELERLELRLHARLEQRRRRSWQRDRLTDVLTRPAVLEALDGAISRAGRTGRPVAMALIEVLGLARTAARRDDIVADQAMRAVAQRIEQWVRREDLVGRVGRQTLLVGFIDCAAEDAARRLETLNEAWRRVARRQEAWRGVSLCCGIADTLEVEEGDVLRQAETRLARALTRGADSVIATGGA